MMSASELIDPIFFFCELFVRVPGGKMVFSYSFGIFVLQK